MTPEILVVLALVFAAPVVLGALRKSGGGAREDKIFQAWKGFAKEFGLSMNESTLEIKGEYLGYSVLVTLPKKEGAAKKDRGLIDVEAEVEIRVDLSGIWMWGLEIEAVDIEGALDYLDSEQNEIGVYNLGDGFRFACPPLVDPKMLEVSFGAHAHIRELLGEGTDFEIIDGSLQAKFPLKKNARDVIHQVNMAVETARQFDETALTVSVIGEDSALRGLRFVRPAVEKSEEEGGGITFLDINRLELFVYYGQESTDEFKELSPVEEGTIPEELSEKDRAVVAKLLELCEDVAMSDQAIRVGREVDTEGDATTEWIIAGFELIDGLRA